MTENSSDPDVIFNRLNIALARSQRVLNSWIPPIPEAKGAEQEDDGLPEEDFKSMKEKAGLESKTAYANDDDLPNGAIQRKKLASNDKLLEQLLGSKAALAKRKSREAGKDMSTSRRAAPKPLTARSKPPHEIDSEEDDEGGRAAAFKSKHSKQHRKPGNLDTMIDDEPTPVDFDEKFNTTTGEATEQGSSPPVWSILEPKATKRKPTSYLDEMLAQRANKKSKKKKSQTNPTN